MIIQKITPQVRW